MIPCKDIVKITKEKTALVIPNAIQVYTRDEKYYFTSFAARDKTFLVLDRVRKCCSADDQVTDGKSMSVGIYAPYFLQFLYRSFGYTVV